MAVDFVDGSLLLANAVLRCLDCNVYINFVANFETIRHRLRRRIDANGNSLDQMFFDPMQSEMVPCKAHNPESRRRGGGRSCAFGESNPDSGGTLSRDLVER